MAPTPIDPRRIPALLIPTVACAALALALSGPAGAAPLRLSLDTVATPGPTAEAVERATAPSAASTEAGAGEDLSFAAAPDLPFPDLAPTPGAVAPDDDWLQTARVQQDEAASGVDRRLGDFAPAVQAALTISTDPIDEVSLPAARSAAAAAIEPTLATRAEPLALPPLAWAAVPVLGLLLLAGAAAWRAARRGRRGAVAIPHGARAAA